MSVRSDIARSNRIVAHNCGWRLLGFIPLVSGNASPAPWGPLAYFRNDATAEKLTHLLTCRVAADERALRNVTTHEDGSLFFYIPAIRLMLPIPFLVTYDDITVEAETKRTQSPEEELHAQRLKEEMQKLLKKIPAAQ